jgi:hypothetical protein
MRAITELYFAGRDNIYEGTWFAYSSMAFLLDRDKPSENLSTVKYSFMNILP